MVIYCHGGLNKKTGMTNFYFEDVEQPMVIDNFDEDRLRGMFLPNQVNNPLASVKLVIISACHSSRLAKVFQDIGIPSVVSIESSV